MAMHLHRVSSEEKDEREGDDVSGEGASYHELLLLHSEVKKQQRSPLKRTGALFRLSHVRYVGSRGPKTGAHHNHVTFLQHSVALQNDRQMRQQQESS